VFVKEHAAQNLEMLPFNGISCFSRGNLLDFSPQPVEADWPVVPNPTNSKLNQHQLSRQNCLQIFPEILNFSQYFNVTHQNLQILTIDQV